MRAGVSEGGVCMAVRERVKKGKRSKEREGEGRMCTCGDVF